MRRSARMSPNMLDHVPGTSRSSATCGRSSPAASVRRIVQRRRRRARSTRGIAGPGLLAHVAVAKYADHCRCTGSRDLRAARRRPGALDAGRLGRRHRPPGRAAGRSARPLRTGRRRRCTPTTRRCRCSIRAAARPRPGGCGRTCAMIDPPAASRPPAVWYRYSPDAQGRAPASAPEGLPRHPAGRRLTPASTASISMAGSAKRPAGRMPGASSTTLHADTARRWPPRR